MITLSCTSDLASGIKGTMKTERSHLYLLYLFIHFINIYSELTGLSAVLDIRKCIRKMITITLCTRQQKRH